ncbi:MAG TPA: ABC transporter permease [Halococcus sp.]|nr:ABC transporter permease [Halococcus sp.]
MNRYWQVARRVVFAIFAAYLVLSVIFVFIALTPDPQLATLKRAAAQEAADEDVPLKQTDSWERVMTYKQRRGLDEPLLTRYRNWMVSYSTFDWGESYGATGQTAFGGSYGSGYTGGVSVTSLVGSALSTTLRYVIPAVILAVIGGLLVGLYTATHQHTLLDRVGTSIAYFGFSLPNFWLAAMVSVVLAGGGWVAGLGSGTHSLLTSVIFPAAIVGTSLFAGQLRYARAQSLEYIDAEFIKLVRAKGASEWRVARHLLRNAAIPLFSLFFSDMIGILVLNIFVIEYVLGIPGLGQLSLVAIQGRDLPVILGTSMVIILFGIVGNLLQDIAYGVLDPRVE